MNIHSASIAQDKPFTPMMQKEKEIHEAAESFVGTFFAQMVEEMFREAQEGSEEDGGFETDTYNGFLATGLGKEMGRNHPLVAQVEDQMRRQAGLETKAEMALKTAPENQMAAHRAYVDMKKKLAPAMPPVVLASAQQEEKDDVRTPAA